MDKIDLTKQYKNLYKAKKDPELVEVPEFTFVTIEGAGNPGNEGFRFAMEALYPAVYGIKFAIKKGDTDLDPIDFKVMPMEGQWWADDPQEFIKMNKDNWYWKIMINVPGFVSKQIFSDIVEKVRQKKNPKRIDDLKLEKMRDGKSVQLMHVGSYDSEAEDIQRMHQFAFDAGYKLHSHHREIYLSDPRRTPEHKLKTILRHPIRKV